MPKQLPVASSISLRFLLLLVRPAHAPLEYQAQTKPSVNVGNVQQ